MEYLLLMAAMVVGLLAFCLSGQKSRPGGT
jgi:hypothetical protein